jgi:hypothetical protein
MQEQQYDYETPEQTTVEQHPLNTDPREQRQPQAESFSPYSEGYSGPERRDIWSEGEKLRIESDNRGKKSFIWVILFLVLLCVVLFAGGISGAFLSWLSWLTLTVLIAAGTFLCIVNWRVVTIPMPERSFQITEHARLILNNGSGKIAIRRGEPGMIAVSATKRASGIRIDPEQIQIDYDQRGDTLGISTKMHWHTFQFGLRSVYFEITVPENCDVQLHNGSGSVTLQGTSGDIRLRTGSGRIEAYDLGGEIELKTGSGSISLGNLQGRMSVVTGSGRIESYGLQGQVELKTGSGRVSVTQSKLAGFSRIITGSGGVIFEGTLDPHGDTQIKTGSGGIGLRLPGDAAFSLDAKTGSGGVVNEFGSSEYGVSPRAHLKLRSGSGRIHITNNGIY